MNEKNSHKQQQQQQQQQQEGCVELGYLLLEQTPIRLLWLPEDRDNATTSSPRPNVWYPVQWGHGQREARCAREDCCQKCEFVTCFEETTETLYLPCWSTTGEEEEDAKTCAPTVSASSRSCICRTRSDGNILFGVLNQLQDDVSIVQCRALFLDDSLDKAAVYLTLGFPRLAPNDGKGKRRSLLGSKTAKPLSNYWQLVLSLLRSNWKELDNFVASLEDRSRIVPHQTTQDTTRKPFSLFPPKLSMEELYRRIQGSSFDEENQQRTLDRQLLQQTCGLAKLPHEILVKSLAPFLGARDLDRLRLTCSYLYGLLEGIVPGMKLQLYRHQILSLGWMRQRERHEIWEKDCLQDDELGGCAPDGDLHRAATGGHTVRLRPRCGKGDTFRVDTLTGIEFVANTRPTDVISRRRVCRGGLLVDEPGLGKTITVLSLILQTAGLSVKHVGELDSDAEDKSILNCYWLKHLTPEYRIKDLSSLQRTIIKRAPRGILMPADFNKRLASDAYGTDFDSFQRDIELCIRETEKADNVNDQAPVSSLVNIARGIFDEFKKRMLTSAKRSYSSPRANVSSELAALIEKSKRHRFIESLVPSRATIIVIPSVLMDHWEAQIDMHVDLKYLSNNKIPLVYTFGTGGISVDSATELIDGGKFEPLVFFDRGGTKTLPPAEFLAKFLIVITTTSRFSQEWKNGSFQREVEKSSRKTPERLFENAMDRSASEVCPLLKIHWIRMIIDEGHSMGRGSMGSHIQFASWISSERRWAMTGTPTKEGRTALTQVRNLMGFLQHDFFAPCCDGEIVWNRYITRPWKEVRVLDNEVVSNKSPRIVDLNESVGAFAAFFRLRSLLKLLMKRHTKDDIVELAPPVYKESFVSMSHIEVATYNSIVTSIQSNLLLTSMRVDARQDSLLHRSQAKYAREALENVRRVCVGFSRVVPTISEKYRVETDFLMNHYQIDREKQQRVKQFINHAETEGLTACDCCGLELSTLLVLPCCGGLICTECMDNHGSIEYKNDCSETWMRRPTDGDKKKQTMKNKVYYKNYCIICDGPFDVDNLQRLQPGFVLTWRENLKIAKASMTSDGEVPRTTGPPDHEAAGNGGLAQNGRGSIWQDTNGETEQIIRPPVARRRTKKPGDGHECEYDRYAVDGKCIHCIEEHNACNLLHSKRCKVCYRAARECPAEETKSSYLVKKCLSLVEGSQPSRRYSDRLIEPLRRVKIIFFSQFRKALDLVGDRLLGRFGTACVSEYWGRYRTQELHKFTHDPACFCMLLGRDGSEGLDLSFVTHIFFLEEIWDRSLAEQTVARAWRMGAKGSVVVETIIAKDSVEETIKAYEAGELQNDVDLSNDFSSEKQEGQQQQQRKAHVLLKSLRLNTDYHQFRKNPRKRPPPSEIVPLSPVSKRRRVTFVNIAGADN